MASCCLKAHHSLTLRPLLQAWSFGFSHSATRMRPPADSSNAAKTAHYRHLMLTDTVLLLARAPAVPRLVAAFGET